MTTRTGAVLQHRRRAWRGSVVALLACVLGAGGGTVCAQRAAGVPEGPLAEGAVVAVSSSSAVPKAEKPASGAASGMASGAVSGTVSDGAGALVPGAHVVLRDATGAVRTVDADEAGAFRFPSLPQGVYHLSVTCPEFEPFASGAIEVAANGGPAALDIRLQLPGHHVDVVVTATRKQMADDEVHAAEQQRVLGLFPNFYMSFSPNPVPLDSGQKFGLALRATTDPTAFFTAGLVASAEQIQKTFPGYGGGTMGYAKRYGAAFADGFTGKMLGSAVFPSVFRQDPRYFYMGTGTVRQRARHAILSAVLARGDNGRWEPNYSHVLGNAAAGALSTTYHPAGDGPGKLALDNALLGTLGEAGVNLVREFVMKPFTRGLPAYAGR